MGNGPETLAFRSTDTFLQAVWFKKLSFYFFIVPKFFPPGFSGFSILEKSAFLSDIKSEHFLRR
jgi:hypothetical protein